MLTSTRTSSATIARPSSTTTTTTTISADSAATLPAVMWAARLAEEVTTTAGTAERIHTGAPRPTEQEALAEAEALAEQLGAAVLWFGAARAAGQVKQAGGGN